MALPEGLGIIDTMIDFPRGEGNAVYRNITAITKDEESQSFKMPAAYLFGDNIPDHAGDIDPIAVTLGEMDKYGIEIGVCGVGSDEDPGDLGFRAVTEHPDRFVSLVSVDPNQGMDAVRRITSVRERFGAKLRGVHVFPAGCNPGVPINDKKLYPVYAKCVELGLPIFVCAGIPGPRVPMASQRVELIDEVMYDFPELVFVTRHGCEPWTDLAVKLMLKWPNLYFSTTAFSPKHYPKAIIDYANTRGADKVLYGGYFPMGLSLERITNELAQLPIKDEVLPKFLRYNAARVLGLDVS